MNWPHALMIASLKNNPAASARPDHGFRGHFRDHRHRHRHHGFNHTAAFPNGSMPFNHTDGDMGPAEAPWPGNFTMNHPENGTDVDLSPIGAPLPGNTTENINITSLSTTPTQTPRAARPFRRHRPGRHHRG